MRLPQGKLLALVALVVAASLVMATGAFSTVTAERSVDVKVTGDKNAFLALQPSDGENSDYAKMSNGKLTINLNGEAGGDVSGEGVNPDAVSSFDNVFTITNQGSQPVTVWIEDGEEKVSFYSNDIGTRIDSEGEAVTVGVGETKEIGIVVDATGVSQGTQLLSGEDSVVIHAVADGSQAPEEAADGPGGGDGA